MSQGGALAQILLEVEKDGSPPQKGGPSGKWPMALNGPTL
jgi:hypothetical protein